MKDKIIARRKFNKSKKDNVAELKIPNGSDDQLEGQIIVEVVKIGNGHAIHNVPESSLDYLLLDGNELNITGWDKVKEIFIDDGIITQSDIDNEKLKPDGSARLQAVRDKMNAV